MNENNIILHCQDGNSDKIYIWSVRKSKNGWDVIGKWGRRGKNVSEQNKGTYSSKIEAIRVAKMNAGKKTVKGYMNINGVGYDGPLTNTSPEVSRYLEDDGDIADEVQEKINKPIKLTPKVKKDGMPKIKKGEVCVAECIDNSGMEDKFDIGVDYIIKGIKDGTDSEMILVYDLSGEEAAYYRDRFGKFRVE